MDGATTACFTGTLAYCFAVCRYCPVVVRYRNGDSRPTKDLAPDKSDIAVRFRGAAELSAGSQPVFGGVAVRGCDRLRRRTWQPGPALVAGPVSQAALAQDSASIKAVT